MQRMGEKVLEMLYPIVGGKRKDMARVLQKPRPRVGLHPVSSFTPSGISRQL